MSTATTIGGPLYAAPAPAAQQRPFFAALLAVRRHARLTFDRMLAAPAAAAGFIRRSARFGWLTGTPLARFASRLSFLKRLLRSVGAAPVVLSVVCSPTAQRVTAQAARAIGEVLVRSGKAAGRAVQLVLSLFGAGGAQMGQRLQDAAQKGAEAVRNVVESWAPRFYVGVAAAGVALEVCRPLLRGLQVHRLLSHLVPSRLLRVGLDLLVVPALVDGRAGRWLCRAASRLYKAVRGWAERRTMLIVLDPGAEAGADGTRTHGPDRPVPSNRAERREAQRQQALARRRARTA